MRLPRTSIAALMGCVLIVALACAALLHPTPLWAAVCLSGMLLALTYALVVALFSRGRRRAFWAGFAIGGGSYLFVQYGPFCAERIGPHTLPTAVLDLAYGAVRDRSQPSLPFAQVASKPSLKPARRNTAFSLTANANLAAWAATPAADPWLRWTTIVPRRPLPSASTPPDFYRIGHSFLNLFLALGFALVARRAADRKELSRNERHTTGPITSAEPAG